MIVSFQLNPEVSGRSKSRGVWEVHRVMIISPIQNSDFRVSSSKGLVMARRQNLSVKVEKVPALTSNNNRKSCCIIHFRLVVLSPNDEDEGR